MVIGTINCLLDKDFDHGVRSTCQAFSTDHYGFSTGKPGANQYPEQ
jgi:hypothetical protein